MDKTILVWKERFGYLSKKISLTRRRPMFSIINSSTRNPLFLIRILSDRLSVSIYGGAPHEETHHNSRKPPHCNATWDESGRHGYAGHIQHSGLNPRGNGVASTKRHRGPAKVRI